jgi:hypothetical protein
VLDTQAVGEPDQVHLPVGEATPRRGQPEEVARMPPAVRAVDDDLVALAEHRVDRPPLVTERPREQVHEHLDAGAARWRAGRRFVVHHLVAEQLGEGRLVVCGEHLLEHAARARLDVRRGSCRRQVGGHDRSPSPVGCCVFPGPRCCVSVGESDIHASIILINV